MDYEHKKSYRPVTALVVIMIGFFVLVWNHEFLIKEVPVQVVRITNSLAGAQTDTQKQADLLPALVASVRSQKETMNALEEENILLQKQMSQYASTSTSSTDAIEAVPTTKKVLLVVGHTAQTKGAVFGDTTEYELNYDITKKLEREMKSRGYDVTLTHEGGDYTQTFLDYFDVNEKRIQDFRQNKKEQYAKQYPQGVVTNDTDHNHASPLGVVQLYGVNLWANENNMDIVVHMHFNDYPGRVAGKRGTHNGFSIFTPLKTNKHFVESFTLAKAIEHHMLKYTNISTVRNESAGVLESELIAVGQANSTNMPAVLVENGFVYEFKFTDITRREPVLARQANSIANGIEQYFNE